MLGVIVITRQIMMWRRGEWPFTNPLFALFWRLLQFFTLVVICTACGSRSGRHRSGIQKTIPNLRNTVVCGGWVGESSPRPQGTVRSPPPRIYYIHRLECLLCLSLILLLHYFLSRFFLCSRIADALFDRSDRMGCVQATISEKKDATARKLLLGRTQKSCTVRISNAFSERIEQTKDFLPSCQNLMLPLSFASARACMCLFFSNLANSVICYL